MQGVVERADVGVDLVVERAGQEAQPLAGLDGGAGEDDPVNLLVLQGLDGLGDGQVGLAGAGRADPEDDGVGVDGVHVPLLVEGLGTDRLPAAGEDVRGEHLGGRDVVVDHADHPLDGVGGEALAGADDGDQLGEHVGARGDRGRVARQGDLVAAHVHVGVERGLQDLQEFVARPEHRHHVDGRGYGNPTFGRGD